MTSFGAVLGCSVVGSYMDDRRESDMDRLGLGEKSLVLLLCLDESLLEKVCILGVCESDSKSLCLWFALANISGSIPHPTPITANIGGELHIRNNVVVGADLQSLISAHNQACLSILLVLQQSYIAGTTFLPFVGFTYELEELRGLSPLCKCQPAKIQGQRPIRIRLRCVGKIAAH
jgi:hypothetical protein